MKLVSQNYDVYISQQLAWDYINVRVALDTIMRKWTKNITPKLVPSWHLGSMGEA